MLPRVHRLRLRREITRVVRAGRSLPGRTLILHVLSNTERSPRFAVVVSSHVARRAVDRNRVKRRIRAALETLIGEFPPNLDLLVRVRRAALSQSTAELTAELHRTLTRHHLLRP